MVSPALVLSILAAYLAVLFAIAAFGDRRAAEGRSIIGSATVYALSWGVYCTAWTYFGSVGRAATGGIWFLPIYLGPMLAMLGAWIVLRKMVRIAQEYRITSIADFIASRYGKSPALAAVATLITVVGILPYIALQLKAVSAGFDVLVHSGADEIATTPEWWQSQTFYVVLALAAFTILFGTRHLDSAERHEGMVAAVAFESVVKLGAFLIVGVYVTWGLFDGPADIWARASAVPELAGLARLDAGPGEGFAGLQWFTLTLLAMLSVLLLPRQFQVMVVECVAEANIRRAAWVFAAYLLLINIFVLPLAFGGMLHFGIGNRNPENFVLSLPLETGATWIAILAYLGGVSAATGMLIVETIAVSTMICNDLVMPTLLRMGIVDARSGDLTRLLLNVRRAAILAVLLLGYLYFRIAGDAYALVSIGLISFAAVAQFAPALFGGMFWRGGTARGAMAGLIGGFAVWVWTLLLPSMAKSGWLPGGFMTDGPFGLTFLRPESLFHLTELDYLTHSLFWSMLVNIGLYVALSLGRSPSAREASQAMLFVGVYDRTGGTAPAPVFWRGRARLDDLTGLAQRFLGPARTQTMLAEHAAETGMSPGTIRPDAQLVDRVERQLAGAVGSASARVLVSSVVQEEPLGLPEMMEILEEASQIRRYARALEERTEELRAANEALQSLDQMKDDFMSSMTHELRTPLTSIRALAELMLDTPDMEDEERAEFLRITVTESERLGRLVNQVLDMAKMESGQSDWLIEDVDLRQIAADAAQITAELFRKRRATLITDLHDVPVIRADPDRLKQVLLNLLSNAVKFVPEGTGTVTMVLRPDRDGLILRVSDNGPGIPENQRAAVFEKFRQIGDPAARPPGTGLGLPITRRIVNHFGGEIWVESAAGGGACFVVRLPLSDRDDQSEGGGHGAQGADRG